MLQLTQAAPPEIHVSGVGGVTTIPRRIMPSCRRGHVSSIDDAEQMRDAISCAQLEGKRARRRVQVPCLVASTLLFASAIVVVLTAGRVDQTYFVVLPCSLVTSVVILLFAVLTTDERLTSFAAGSIAMQFMVAAILTAVLALASTLRTGAMSGSCVQTMGEPCWDVILDAVQFSIGSLALLLKGSSLLVEMAWRGSRGRILLEFLWREVRQTCAIAFVVLFPIALVRITTFGGLSERATRFLVAGLWFGCTALVLSTPKLRTRVQSALAARGGALLTAASVAAYIGRADPTEMVRNAEATFRAVPLPLVTLAHLQSNVPDPELYRLTVPVRFSQCDAFVSHSWADDPALKFAALRAWGVRFERLFKRAPLVWIGACPVAWPCCPPSLTTVNPLTIFPRTRTSNRPVLPAAGDHRGRGADAAVLHCWLYLASCSCRADFRYEALVHHRMTSHPKSFLPKSQLQVRTVAAIPSLVLLATFRCASAICRRFSSSCAWARRPP